MSQKKRKPLSSPAPSEDDECSVAKKGRQDDNSRRAGTIEKMILKNFMCHSHLEVDLSSINMITGHNGSGKSAILTALIIGLGGRACLTNRGTNVKNLVKVGKNSGSIEIHIYNQGAMAYRPTVYGGKIIVVRTVQASGGGSYQIKSELGEIITKQMKEVLNITTSLNIQIDNPVCILNQDTSRNFLSSSNPKLKFTLFMKATRLETLEAEYKNMKRNKMECMKVFGEKEVALAQIQEEVQMLQRKINSHKSIVNLTGKAGALKLELLWAKVRDCERALAKEEEGVRELEGELEKIQADCSSKSDRVTAIKEKIGSLKQEVSEVSEALKIQMKPQEDLKRVLDDLKRQYYLKKERRQLVGNTIQMKGKDKVVLETEMSTVNERMSAVEQAKAKRLHDLTVMTDKIKGMEDHLQTMRNDFYQINNDVSHRSEQKQNLRREIQEIEYKINEEKQGLANFRNQSGDNLVVYGRDVPNVLRAIEQHRKRFTHPPKGPLGSYIKLKDKKWAVAAEGHLGGILSAFTVDNRKDSQVLFEIFNNVWREGSRPTIITSKFFFKKHDVSRNLVQAPADCISLYDLLEIEDPIVSNCVVDQAQVEEVLLIPTNERAIQLLSNRADVPRNCRQGITIGGDKFYPDPNYRTYSSRYHRARYLQVDSKDRIAQLEEHIKELMNKKANVQREYETVARDTGEQEAKKNQLDEKIRKVIAARTQIRRQIDELKSAAEPEVANVDLLETELATIKNVLQEKEAELVRVTAEIKEIKAAVTENELKMTQLQESNSGFIERLRELESQLAEEVIRQKEVSLGDDFDKRRLQEITAKLNDKRAALFLKQSALQEETNRASSTGQRVASRKAVHDLVAEIESAERAVRRAQSQMENPEELYLHYETILEKHQRISDVMDALRSSINQLTIVLNARGGIYQLTENYFVSFMKLAFKKFMEVRQFEGSIDINCIEKKLDLHVIPQRGSQGLTTTSNLSGGERSFSTVGFLYSLWQCMEFPFYFLDEFDVFMDKLNRSKVVEILIHHAEAHKELQFVFLTPQDISFVKKNVNILRLEDPERMET